MSTEAFRVSFETANYHRLPITGDKALVFAAREQETRNNLLRYLAEYRLAVKFDEFFYREGKNANGERFLSASEEQPISQVFRKAILQKEKEGKSARREVAECLGFEKIEQKFLQKEDFLFLWISPQGQPEDGYGDYSFTFVGEVKDNKIRVIPYRNELSLHQHKEIAGIFSQDAEKFQTDVDFLANPVFIQKREGLKNAEDLLLQIGEKERMDLSWRQRLEAKVGSLVDLFIAGVKRNAPDSELDRIKRAIENLTIDKKEEITTGNFVSYNFNAEHLIDTYGSYAPPKVSGSCGSSKSTLMEFQSKFNPGSDSFGERSFECPECGKTNVRPEDELLKSCQHCGSSKVSC